MTGKNIKENTYTVLGIMSGTSLDGVDLALCKFRIEKGKWNYQIIDAKTISYPSYWKTMLKDAYTYDEDRLNRLDSEYGEYLGKLARHFLGKKSGTDFISSHGHTIFHNPEKGITRQIGNGEEIAKVCKIPVVFDFRTNDVALGGQGAPLVPVGDRDLFGQYDACLNLGGFSNISFEKNKIRKAFDICPVNIVLNQFALEFGKDFDKNGDLGRNGIIIPSLLEKLNSLTYYSHTGPSSLGVEWLEKEFYPVVKNQDYQTENILSTLYEHISYQISNVLIKNNLKRVLITGGGAYNGFLIEKIKKQSPVIIVIPENLLINFKEALIFAFLGILKLRNEINCLSSVTGASKDNIGGKIARIK